MSHRIPSLLFALGALTSAVDAQSFTYTDFTSTAGVNLVGLSTQAGNILRLQDNVAPASGGDNRGGAWYATPVCVAQGFDTTFTYRMHTPSTTGGSDGLAFVIQNDQGGNVAMVNQPGASLPVGAGSTALGRHAAAIGYGNFATSLPGETVDDSIAIELDTFSSATAWGDPDGNHISIHTGGSGDNGTHESFSIGRANSAALGVDLNNGVNHTVRVVYTAGSPGTLQVYLDGNLKVTAPYSFATGGTWIDSGTAVGGLNLLGGNSAYVGFTSGAGSAREFRDILSWTWSSNCPPTITPFCFGDGTLTDHTTPCPCANNGTVGNGCANSVNANGANLATSGAPSTDDVVLLGSGMPLTVSCIYLQGTATDDVVFGDGVRCTGGSLLRLRTKTNVGGASSFPDSVETITLSARGGVTPGSGAIRYYQTYYRNSSAIFCPPETFNVTNGQVVIW
ncbi:MAG: hypothetical protein HZA53_05035 [Planctomycetes bacterium]|nr:hypothetical protein [Planctomycetota bacterium]